MKVKSTHNSTLSVHAGTKQAEDGGVNTPIHTSTAYDFRGEEIKYPRIGNTLNQQALAEKVAALSAAEHAMVFSSGMAAISCAMLSLLKPGDHFLIQRNIYGGTYALINGYMKELGISFTYFDENELESLPSLVQENTKLVYFESPSNPMLHVVDIEAIVQFAQTHNLLSVTDNTFASAILQKPIAMGVDVVIESGSKYMSGHSDIMMGSIACNKSLYQHIKPMMINLGAVLDAVTAYQLEKTMKTMDLRVRKQAENALALAQKLKQSQKLREVRYPGLPDAQTHEIAKKQMHGGFGSIITFDLAPKTDVSAFLAKLKLIAPAVSLGGVESTINAPALTSHHMLQEEERAKLGIENGTMRLSVGIEAVDDVFEDIMQAVEAS